MEKVKASAIVLDDAVEQLSEAWDLFLEACGKADRAYQAKQKDRVRVGFSLKVPAVHPHPVFNAPNKLFRSRLGGHPRLAKALSIPVTQVRAVSDLVPEGEGEDA